MYTIISYSITHPGKKDIFSCIVRPDKGGHPFSIVIPFKFSDQSEKIINQARLILDDSEILWREGLEKPENTTRKS